MENNVSSSPKTLNTNSSHMDPANSFKQSPENNSDINPKRKMPKSKENVNLIEMKLPEKENKVCKGDSFEEEDIFLISSSLQSSSSDQEKTVPQKVVHQHTGADKEKDFEYKQESAESIGCQIDANQSLSMQPPCSLPSSDKETGSEISSFKYQDNDPLSTSYCETESLASLSQSVGSEDLSFTVQRESKKIKKQKKKEKRKEKSEVFFEDPKAKYLRPNYFVGIQISNPEIHKGVVAVQNMLVAFNEKLFPALIDVSTLHITLLVAHIDSENDLNVACSALDHCGAILSETLSDPPLRLTFSGISHFSNQTLYAKLTENDQYHRLVSAASVVRKVFGEKGIIMPDKRDLVPHLTLAKLSKVPRGKGKSGIRKIDPVSYETHTNKTFGEQVIGGLQLLSMNDPKDINRYYHCSREVPFNIIPTESLDHSLCCRPRQPPTPSIFRIDH